MIPWQGGIGLRGQETALAIIANIAGGIDMRTSESSGLLPNLAHWAERSQCAPVSEFTFEVCVYIISSAVNMCW